jgi:hypothetical protein
MNCLLFASLQLTAYFPILLYVYIFNIIYIWIASQKSLFLNIPASNGYRSKITCPLYGEANKKPTIF